MNISYFNKNTKELLVVSSDCFLKTSKYSFVNPTICLIYFSEEFDKSEIVKMVNILIEIGVVFFITYGSFSEKMHDLIDEVIETSHLNLSHIVTASQSSQTIEDTAYFFLKATYFGDDYCRYIIIFDRISENINCFQKEAINLFNA
ncbi:MAG: hypothetical protein LBG21_00725 [Campylobacteraceae bacterium]|jgi:hypothetical protein|nr:hypothetical protein [Campylobacteraceae bacterium]